MPLVSTIAKSMARATRSSFMRYFNKLSEEVLCAVGGESGLSPPNLVVELAMDELAREARAFPRGQGPIEQVVTVVRSMHG